MRLGMVASTLHSAAEVAEFLDYRGVVIERHTEVYQCYYSVYFLRKYADAIFPMLSELLANPLLGEKEFNTYCAKRRQQISASYLKTGDMARRIFYRALFGSDHPLGRFATPVDADRLGCNMVDGYFSQHLSCGPSGMVLAGNVDDQLVAQCKERLHCVPLPLRPEPDAPRPADTLRQTTIIPGTVQTSIRIGRILPLKWDSMDYARFIILTTALGGYFGSRLMSNLREDKGYTYGIYARTQIYYGHIVFFITADVPNSVADDAIHEIMGEMERLAESPMDDTELQLVKTVIRGDYLRSIDGVFECSARLVDMLGSSTDDRMTENLLAALEETTAAQLQELAQRLFNPNDMFVCTAGV